MPDSPKTPPTARQPNFDATDPYLVLGVSPTADKAEIKRAYFSLIRQYTPEKEAEKFKIIRGAYEKLKSASRRAETDALLPKAPPLQNTPLYTVHPETIRFKPADAMFALEHEGDLGRNDFSADFQEINW